MIEIMKDGSATSRLFFVCRVERSIMRHLTAMLIGTAMLVGCSLGKGVAPAEHAIDTFHRQLNTGNFTPIWTTASPEMTGAATAQGFDQLLGAVHRKLGLFRSGKALGWNDNRTTGGEFVTINYDATYDRGKAQENFVYRIDGTSAKLAGYHVNSNALIIN